MEAKRYLIEYEDGFDNKILLTNKDVDGEVYVYDIITVSAEHLPVVVDALQSEVPGAISEDAFETIIDEIEAD